MASLRKMLCASVLCAISMSAEPGPEVTIMFPRDGIHLQRYDVTLAFSVKPTTRDARTFVLVRTNQGTAMPLEEWIYDPEEPAVCLSRRVGGGEWRRTISGSSMVLYGVHPGPLELSLLAYEYIGGGYRETIRRVLVMVDEAAVTEWTWEKDPAGVRFPEFMYTSLLAVKRMPGVCDSRESSVGLATSGGDWLNMDALEPVGEDLFPEGKPELEAVRTRLALANTLVTQDKYAEADAMYSSVMQEVANTHGENHPLSRRLAAISRRSSITSGRDITAAPRNLFHCERTDSSAPISCALWSRDTLASDNDGLQPFERQWALNLSTSEASLASATIRQLLRLSPPYELSILAYLRHFAERPQSPPLPQRWAVFSIDASLDAAFWLATAVAGWVEFIGYRVLLLLHGRLWKQAQRENAQGMRKFSSPLAQLLSVFVSLNCTILFGTAGSLTYPRQRYAYSRAGSTFCVQVTHQMT